MQALRHLSRAPSAISCVQRQRTLCISSHIRSVPRRNFTHTAALCRKKKDDEPGEVDWDFIKRSNLIPAPRGGLDVKQFLEKIGRGCAEHADKFASWEDLFTAKTEILKERDIPCQQRKWILHWCEKYRHGNTPGLPPLQRPYKL